MYAIRGWIASILLKSRTLLTSPQVYLWDFHIFQQKFSQALTYYKTSCEKAQCLLVSFWSPVVSLSFWDTGHFLPTQMSLSRTTNDSHSHVDTRSLVLPWAAMSTTGMQQNHWPQQTYKHSHTHTDTHTQLKHSPAGWVVELCCQLSLLEPKPVKDYSGCASMYLCVYFCLCRW